jgi:hypothetical protein
VVPNVARCSPKAKGFLPVADLDPDLLFVSPEVATQIMKFIVLAILFGTCLLANARADLTIVQKIEGAGQSGEVTIKIKGEKERIDSPSQPTRIIDGSTGEMMNLVNDRKTVVRISAEQMKAAAQTISKYNDGDSSSEKPKLAPTGNKETISGYNTDEYVYQTPQFKATFWIARTYPDATSILKQMQMPVSRAWKPSNLGMPDYRDFPGVPLKTVISVGTTEVSTTVTSIKHDQLGDSEFTVPKDYQELKPPAVTAPQPAGSKSAPVASPTP